MLIYVIFVKLRCCTLLFAKETFAQMNFDRSNTIQIQFCLMFFSTKKKNSFLNKIFEMKICKQFCMGFLNLRRTFLTKHWNPLLHVP